MKVVLAPLLAVLFLVGCQTTGPVAPKVEQIPVPVPFCPAPPDYMSKIQKEGGLDVLTEQSPPGEVAKQWHYEVEYLRGLVDIQSAIIEAYRKNHTDLQSLESDIQRLIDETNTSLQDTQPPSQ